MARGNLKFKKADVLKHLKESDEQRNYVRYRGRTYHYRTKIIQNLVLKKHKQKQREIKLRKSQTKLLYRKFAQKYIRGEIDLVDNVPKHERKRRKRLMKVIRNERRRINKKYKPVREGDEYEKIRLNREREFKEKRDAEPFFSVNKERSREFFTSNGVKKTEFSILFNKHKNLNGFKDYNELHREFTRIFNKTFSLLDIGRNDQVAFMLYSDTLKNDKYQGYISTSLKARKYINSYDFASNIQGVMNSHASFRFDENIKMSVVVVIEISGGAIQHGMRISDYSDIVKKRSAVKIKTTPELPICMQKSVVVCIKKRELKTGLITKSQWNAFRKDTGKVSTKLAIDISTELNIDTEKPCGILDIKKIESYFGIVIRIVDYEKNLTFSYEGAPMKEEEEPYYILNHNNHYDAILDIKKFLGVKNFCHTCIKSYVSKHSCLCSKCHRKHPSKPFNLLFDDNSPIRCEDCNWVYDGEFCYDTHLEKLCKTRRKCKTCRKSLGNNHKCGMRFCRNCKDFYEQEMSTAHKCYMIQKDFQEDVRTVWYYDFETVRLPNHKFEVNYAVLIKDKNLETKYDTIDEVKKNVNLYVDSYKCGDKVFNSYDKFEAYALENDQSSLSIISHEVYTFRDITSFCKFVFQSKHKKNIFIAHNSQGFDAQFIMKYILENFKRNTPTARTAGSKIKYLKDPKFGIEFIDSMSFFMTSLANFPKMFGIKTVKKGYFPHLFNTPVNQNYVGNIPAIDFYDPDNMKDEQSRQKFFDWYAKQTDIFDFQKELHEYCLDDVILLKKGCEIFRKNIKAQLGCNFGVYNYSTIASFCFSLYRSKFMKKDMIPIIPDFQPTMNQSSKGIAWLEYVARTKKVKISHAGNGRECMIFGRKVDGYDEKNKTIYEFHGCFWHGCKKCYKNDGRNQVIGKQFTQLYRETAQKCDNFRASGRFTVVEMWECDWDMIADEVLLDSEKVKHIKRKRLNVRDALFGGRTNATKLYTDLGDEFAHYADVVSMYPYVQYYKPYPVGHPDILTYSKGVCYNTNGDRDDPDYVEFSYDSLHKRILDGTLFGLVKCSILPPRGLYHPVLPCKIDVKKTVKLIFGLCRSCMKDQITECTHMDDDRVIHGTWTTIELQKALQKGYKLTEITEVYHWKRTSTELFKEYINFFLKMKIEASGWDKLDCNTDEEKAAFITECKKRYGFKLTNVDKNPGKRTQAKLALNNLWGKLCQNTNKYREKKYFSSYDDGSKFREFINNPGLDEFKLFFTGGNKLLVEAKKKAIHNMIDFNTCATLGVFTTSHARICLYNALDTLGDKVIYYDTDSVIYRVKEKDDRSANLNFGGFLGDWEIEDVLIDKVISSGPKSYAYRDYKHKKFHIKIKGFYLNFRAQKTLNIDSFEKEVLDNVKNTERKDNGVPIHDFKFSRNKLTRDISFEDDTIKYFKLTYDKRVIQEPVKQDGKIVLIDTKPYGY